MSLKQRIEHLEQHIFGRVDPRGHGDDGDLESGLREMHDEWRSYKAREARPQEDLIKLPDPDAQSQTGDQQADLNAKPQADGAPEDADQRAANERREREEREAAEKLKESAAEDTAEKHDE